MPDTVTASVAVEYRTWEVPREAVHVAQPGTRQQGMRLSQLTKVEHLDPIALERLTRAWVEALYAQTSFSAPRLVYE